MNGVGIRRFNPRTLTLTKALTSYQYSFRQPLCIPATGRPKNPPPLFSQAHTSFSNSAIIGKDPIVTVTPENSTTSTKSTSESSSNLRLPRKAAVQVTEEARTFLNSLLDHVTETKKEIVGIILKYEMSSGKFRMVFKFDFITAEDIGKNDEGVSLDVLEDGSPKPPSESWDDGLPKLYVQANAFLKVLGGTVDVKFNDDGSFIPVLYDREGNVMDPNA